MNRSGPVGAGDPHRFGDGGSGVLGLLDRPRGFRQMCCHIGLRHFLKGALADAGDGRVAAQQHHRAFRHAGRIKRGQCVCESGPGRHQGNGDIAGQLRAGFRHMDRGGFVADVDDADLFVQEGIEQHHDLVAGHGEDGIDAGRPKGLRGPVRTADRV